ncbi:MAG: hypothetical protein ACR2PL_25890 [Dehalococcoidia bacterium]
MASLADRFPIAEEQIRDGIEDLIVPSEPAVQTTVQEDSQGRFWVAVACPMVEFKQEAAFDRDDLAGAIGAWPLWCERLLSELDRRLREQGKSGW